MQPPATPHPLVNAPAPDVSILIVSYHSGETLGATLGSVFAQQGVDFEVLLVDNEASAQVRAIAAPWLGAAGGGRLRCFASPVNRGFGGANNDAARLARAPLLMLLNPDVVLPTPATLARLVERARGLAANCPRGVIIGCKTLAGDGTTLLHAGGVVELPAHTRMRGRGEPDTGQYDQPADVDFVEGSCVLLPAALWRRLGGFRPIYWPAYYEDTDLCLRARRAGARVVYVPEAVIHREKTREQTHDAQFWIMYQAARVLFTLLNFGPWTLLSRALPAEWRWFWQPELRWQRGQTLRAYRRVAGRLVRGWLGRQPGPPPVALEDYELNQ